MEGNLKAVILAAGVGSRLGYLTKNKPKCMLSVLPNKTLIDYQIDTLNYFGISDANIYIIAGYKVDVLKSHLKNRKVNIIFNPKYRNWNNIYSFYMIYNIKDLKNEDSFILLNSDTFFHKEILENLLKTKYKNCVVLDTYKDLKDEEMKVLTENSKVIKFGKDLSTEESTGEYIGLAKFNKGSLSILFEKMKNLIDQGKTDIWYEIAFNYVLDRLNIYYIDTLKKPWIEIDTYDDFEKAKSLKI